MILSPPKIFRYRLNHDLRSMIHHITTLVVTPERQQRLDLSKEQLKKILIVRATFRMGDSILAIPAVKSFRKRFPEARIDFLGAPISAEIFKNLPIDNHFTITRRYPGSGWHYPVLIRRLRSIRYDLAIDVSCSQSAMGSFLVGFSGARLRVGLKGKWDQWFNVKIDKQSEINKYKTLPNSLTALGLELDSTMPLLPLSVTEIENGRSELRSLLNDEVEKDMGKPIAGVFVGGRKSWGKRWPLSNFCRVISGLYRDGVNVVAFIGPEEKDLSGDLRNSLDPHIPLIAEPSLRKFAAMVSNCDLFVTGDSGPMHLAYALGTRTVAIFLYPNFDRWGPPGVRIAYQSSGCSPEEVLRICREELSRPVLARCG